MRACVARSSVENVGGYRFIYPLSESFSRDPRNDSDMTPEIGAVDKILARNRSRGVYKREGGTESYANRATPRKVMGDSPVFEPFQPVTLVDCPSPEPPEAAADAPPPEAIADPPTDVALINMWTNMHSRARSLTETRDPLRILMLLPITTFGFDITLARAMNAVGIFQDTNFADEETRTLSVMCPILPPGGARVDRPTRRE